MTLYAECMACGDRVALEQGEWVHTADNSPAGTRCERGDD